MVDLWYPNGIHDPAPPFGRHADLGEPKFVLHTTEGGPGVYIPDPRQGPGRRYFGNLGTWPNYTLARQGRNGPWRIFNHIPADRPSLSLRNRPASNVETNRDNVSQIEIAWKAGQIDSLPDEAFDELAQLLAWEHAARGLPLVSTVRWVGSEGARLDAPQRLSEPAWDAYSGILGHQHAPKNDHWDPGKFPIEKLLSRARDIAEGDVVTEQDKMDIASRVLAELRTQVFDVQPTIRQGNAGNVIGATYNKVGDLQSALTNVSGRIDFLYDQLGKIAAASGVALDPPPWRPPTPPVVPPAPPIP